MTKHWETPSNTTCSRVLDGTVLSSFDSHLDLTQTTECASSGRGSRCPKQRECLTQPFKSLKSLESLDLRDNVGTTSYGLLAARTVPHADCLSFDCIFAAECANHTHEFDDVFCRRSKNLRRTRHSGHAGRSPPV